MDLLHSRKPAVIDFDSRLRNWPVLELIDVFFKGCYPLLEFVILAGKLIVVLVYCFKQLSAFVSDSFLVFGRPRL